MLTIVLNVPKLLVPFQRLAFTLQSGAAIDFPNEFDSAVMYLSADDGKVR